MFRRVKKWAAKAEKLIPKPKIVRVECTIEEPTGEQTTILQEKRETLLSVLRNHGFCFAFTFAANVALAL